MVVNNQDDVMDEIEAFVSKKRVKKHMLVDGDDVYDMCD